jgi:hypothetical protein
MNFCQYFGLCSFSFFLRLLTCFFSRVLFAFQKLLDFDQRLRDLVREYFQTNSARSPLFSAGPVPRLYAGPAAASSPGSNSEICFNGCLADSFIWVSPTRHTLGISRVT